MDTKELQGLIDSASEAIKTKAVNAETIAQKAMDSVTEFVKGKEAAEKEIITLKEANEQLRKDFNEMAANLSKAKFSKNNEVESFHNLLGEGLAEKKAELSSLAGNKKKLDTSIEIKAVGDINFANFGTGAYAAATTEVRQGLYQSPFSPLWLRNILPGGSTTSAAIQYLRENGGEGAAGIWTDENTPSNKPQVDFDWELVTDTVDWIAGWTKIHRSMLDDITWMQSFLANQLIYGRRGLFVAENGLITDAFAANSVAYNGDKTIPIERVYDAAFGQLRDFYFNPTHILMNHRDVVNYVALNKAPGSGEYDLPAGSVIVLNGQMIIGGVPVIGVPNLAQGEFQVIDNRATQFVSRMSPEVRFFDQNEDDAKKNLVMVRAEERAAVLIFDENAIITGDLEPTS